MMLATLLRWDEFTECDHSLVAISLALPAIDPRV
jgi:hypothetical protein